MATITNKSYLDESGLAYFWSKIKTLLSGKQNKLKAGAGISIQNDVISSTNTGISILDCYPVGSYYETSDTSFNPNTAWGGTWVEDTAGRVLVAMDSGTFATVGDTGGEETHTITTNEMPSHNHPLQIALLGTGGGVSRVYGASFSTASTSGVYTQNSAATSGEIRWGIKNAGGGNAHNNLQPYTVIKRWHRTA